MTIVAGGVLGVKSFPTGLHTLTLVKKTPTWAQGTLGHRGTPTGRAGAVADFASAVVVQVMLCWTLGNTFPMVQDGFRQTAHAIGVVRETGGTGRIAGVAYAFLTVETSATVRDTSPVFEQGSRVGTGHTLLLARPTAF